MPKGRTHADFLPARLGTLIAELGPHNNRWRDGSPCEKVLALWQMGDVLLRYVENPSDRILWEIQQRSYITRTILRYALIVRRTWRDSHDLERLVAGLRSFTVFREALPFLKGDRYGIDAEHLTKVTSLLHSPDTRTAVRSLKDLKRVRIGRQHKKGVSLAAAREGATLFARELSELERRVSDGSMGVSPAADSYLASMSQTAMALATGEDTQRISSVDPEAVAPLLSKAADALCAAAKGTRSQRAAFRKLVGADRLMEASDLLNSLRFPATLTEWRRRHAKPFKQAVLKT